jgi:hypothetical protein
MIRGETPTRRRMLIPTQARTRIRQIQPGPARANRRRRILGLPPALRDLTVSQCRSHRRGIVFVGLVTTPAENYPAPGPLPTRTAARGRTGRQIICRKPSPPRPFPIWAKSQIHPQAIELTCRWICEKSKRDCRSNFTKI